MAGTGGAPPPPRPVPAVSWAKRTGFKGRVSGESNASDSGQIGAPSRNRESEVQPDLESGRPRERTVGNGQPAERDQVVKKRRDSDGVGAGSTLAGINGQARSEPSARMRRESDSGALPSVPEEEPFGATRSHIKYELRDSPGLVPIAFYGLQHFLSMLGSLILIPLVIVPAMGGSQDDKSQVISTVLLVSGISTLLHTSFGSRLPLVQGPSFVYLAPTLAMINSPEFGGLTTNNFKHIMKELQGAIIISSAFQALLGYSGLMSIFLRLVNPVVASPTIAAVGLSFFSYGFTVVGTCLEIGILQILLVIIFSLYLRKISLFGHRIFLIYAVPLALAIAWAVAFLLTESGAYSYKGCNINVPVSNIVSDYCRKHVSRMKSCRVDTSYAMKSSPWLRVPYPLQWGTPIFNWKMAFVMCMVSIIASVDSQSRPPTAGVVSRGLGLEGVCGVLSGLCGTGTGFSTLTENIHTIAVTKMGSRRGVEVGAFIVILLSFVVASHGPFHSKYNGVNYVMNMLLSFNMVIAFILAIILDNTVPGSRQERGAYIWSEQEAARREPSLAKDYELPFKVGRPFRWVKWVGF